MSKEMGFFGKGNEGDKDNGNNGDSTSGINLISLLPHLMTLLYLQKQHW